MTRGLEPTEEYDGSIIVHILNDMGDNEREQCSSYQEAIQVVKQNRQAATATKIEDRDGTIVFTSDGMNLEDWVAEWENAKRSLSVDIEAHECPYDNVACVADDLCVRCSMDGLQDQY
jgi:hypothetical protein